jgi:dihydrodipicolinate synthase/N-acetylneuraminate lyase
MFVLSIRPAGAAVSAGRGRVLAGRLAAGGTGVMAVLANAVPAAGREVPAALVVLATAPGGRLARARPGQHRDVHKACGRGL